MSSVVSNSPKQTSFTIGMIGCGQVGTRLLTLLLEKMEGNDVLISRRQPEKLKQVSDRKNIKIVFDNAYIAQNASVIVLLIQPIHLKAVIDEIKHTIASRPEKLPKLIVISCLALGDRNKLQAELGGNAIVEQVDIVSIILECIGSERTSSANIHQFG
jgi:pyrroline-5-carboxylate reductase